MFQTEKQIERNRNTKRAQPLIDLKPMPSSLVLVTTVHKNSLQLYTTDAVDPYD